METNSKLANFKEKAKDVSIKGVSHVCGVGHFVCRLAADGFKELEAQGIHAIDGNCTKRIIRMRRDFSYAQRMRDMRERIEQTKQVVNETYEEIVQPETEEHSPKDVNSLTVGEILQPHAG